MSVKRSASLVAFKSFEPLNFPDVCVSFFINFVYWPLTSARNGDVTVGDLL